VVEVVAEALGSLESISDKVKGIEAAIESVSSIAQQSASSSQQMSAGVQQTSSAMQQVSSAAQQLSSTSQELATMVAEFKVRNDVTSGIATSLPIKQFKPVETKHVDVTNAGSRSSLETVVEKSKKAGEDKKEKE